jgi:predicted aspartyl protease
MGPPYNGYVMTKRDDTSKPKRSALSTFLVTVVVVASLTNCAPPPAAVALPTPVVRPECSADTIKVRVRDYDQLLAEMYRLGCITGQAYEANLRAHHPSDQVAVTAPSSAPSLGGIPLGRKGGVFTVPAVINDAVKLDFVLDSGAADVIIPEDVVLTLIRSGTVARQDLTGIGRYTLADGSEHEQLQLQLRELRIGDRTVRNVAAGVNSVQGEPLLGQALLSRFGSWTIDNRRQMLVLSP